jgi:hypothetical protein
MSQAQDQETIECTLYRKMKRNISRRRKRLKKKHHCLLKAFCKFKNQTPPVDFRAKSYPMSKKLVNKIVAAVHNIFCHTRSRRRRRRRRRRSSVLASSKQKLNSTVTEDTWRREDGRRFFKILN